MQFISRYNKGLCFSFCAIDVFSKYAWIIPLKDIKDEKNKVKRLLKQFKKF